MILTNAYVDTHLVGTYVIYISLVFSIFSAVEYIVLFARAVKYRADSPDDDDGPARATRDLGTE